MIENLSKAQIDKLGDRFRDGSPSESDLRVLDFYRESFGEAYRFVIGAIQKNLKVEPTGRPTKSTASIAEKLHRESIRLSQMQDIAGCRIVVRDILAQDQIILSLQTVFSDIDIIDRRVKPSHGYRAVHGIVSLAGKPIEIQVRSFLQHLWAQCSEKWSDVFDPRIKYGGGPSNIQAILMQLSDLVAGFERHESDFIYTDDSLKKKADEVKDKITSFLLLSLKQIK